jgi:hypothetical protein
MRSLAGHIGIYDVLLPVPPCDTNNKGKQQEKIIIIIMDAL